MTGPTAGDERDPADRLESALNRIAYALQYGATTAAPPAGPAPVTGPSVDLHAVAANLDAVTHRIRALLDETSADRED